MKTFIKETIKSFVRMVFGALCVVAFACVYLYLQGNLHIEKVEEDHNKQVFVDGELVSNTDWTELFGYRIQIDLKDGCYIGK